MCFAEDLGLEAGLTDWTADLVYTYDLKRPVWSVQNLLVDDAADCQQSGASLRLDVVTGELLGEYGWSSIC